MNHKDVEAETKKKCEKCGFSGRSFPHVVYHRPKKLLFSYAPSPLSPAIFQYAPEAMIFICTRCSYEWEIEVTG